ncbi:hypothetical protein M2408_002172 [Sphingobacterium sp. BIGb0165]|nr:hypothetical protein [Sphingobacterium sp. BIGb0165]
MELYKEEGRWIFVFNTTHCDITIKSNFVCWGCGEEGYFILDRS